MSEKACPICGAGGLVVREEAGQVSAPLGRPVGYLEEVATCPTCGESGDFANVNDERIEAARKQSALESIPALYERLLSDGRSMAYVERALDLPARTLARWKAGSEASAGALALLRILATFPWLVEVAEAGYDPPLAEATLVKAAAATVARFLATERIRPDVTVTASSGSANVNMAFRRFGAEPARLPPNRVEVLSIAAE